MGKILPIITLAIVSVFSAKSQITTSTLSTTQYVQNVLLGPGVTASNITYTGLPKMIASYTAPAITNLGITKGVYLTCGSNGLIPTEEGPAGPSSAMQSVDQGQPGDAALNALTTSGTQDAAVLEFDFVPQSDTVRFRYVFGSEEYNDFVNSSFNDVFAFILSGVSTPLSATNIALIPGTSTPITINNVNNGNSSGTSTGPCSNCTYYRDNINGSIDCIYDGLTVVLTAKHKVLCGETYHIKIAIADAGDGSLDSGVFLEAGSFSSVPPVSVSSSNSNATFTDSVIVEDCNTNCVYFVRNGNLTQKDSFNLQVSGNAILGLDYIQQGNSSFAWPTKIIFNANQDTVKICNLKAISDNLAEGTDTIVFTLTSYTTGIAVCALTSSIKFKLFVKDYIPINIGQNDSIICNGQGVLLNANASYGLAPYTYTWNPSNSNLAFENIPLVTQPVTYTIQVNDICNKPVTKVIQIVPSTLPVISNAGPYKFCLDSTKKIPIEIIGGKPSFMINWLIPLNGLVPYDTLNNTFYFTQSNSPYSGTYTITVSDMCNNKDTINVEISTIDCDILVPNVVTPNGDGINEYFKINGIENFSGSSLVVFNRWGNKIYSSTSYKNDWKPEVVDGTYFYILNVSDGRKFNGFFQVFKE